MSTERRYSPLDRLLMGVDRSLRGAATASTSGRGNPSQSTEAAPLKPRETRHAAGLMRVNHAGEIAAQALYLGQAAVARDPGVRDQLLQAAAEERDHLRWCEERLTELGSKPSRLDPAWYAGSYVMGVLAGLTGDRTSLGFVAETERQVVEHLESHLGKLPERDLRSRAIVRAMQHDEAWHGEHALASGGRELPAPVRRAMQLIAKVMTKTAYWI